MNKIYRLIWNATARLWQVAGELGRQGRKRTGGRRLVAAGSLYLLPLAALGGELPSGGTVVTGVGSIEQFDKHLSITQGSERLAIEWQQFNIGEGNRVSFNQPSASAIALNRVIGTDGSRIMGQLDANGRVFLINPNGVLFGKNAQVDVGGLVASTLDISNEDFAAGNYRFRGNGNNAAIINKGHITAADGGAVALLGGHVSNEGVISARLGSVALVAGEQVTLDFAGDGLLKVQVDEATRDALVENHQLIQADGGQVLMSAHAADALLQTVVNNTGVIEARTLENRNGKIVLLGGFEGGTVEVAGKLDASAPEGGDGGFIDTSGAHVQIHEGLEVTTLAVDGRTGDWLIDPTDLTISAGSAPQTDSGIGADTLSANLESSNITLQTVAEGSEAGNIYVNGEVSWDAATTLTLSAHSDIHINQNISATTGKLALEYGQADVAAGNTADYHVNARVNLSAGQNFSTRLGSDGDVLEYTVITELGAEGSTSGTDLQGMQGNLNGLYALGADINASATESWDGGAGFNPIGDYSNSNGFTGVFDGLGHLITGLTINRPSQDDVGLFGYTKGAWLRNIGLQRGRVVGRDSVGSLVGMNQGAISQSWASVAVNGASTVGGLVGWNRNAGGSGEINHGTINESYAVGPVSGNIMYVGGLVGYNAWQISNSYATGVVSGNEYVGGLVGENFGTITNTYATGAVSGSDSVGGLVGAAAYGDIAESYWNTETTGQTSSAGGGTGLTTAELIEALPVGFDPEVWDNAGNQTTPYLLGLSGNRVFNKNDLPSGTISASNRPVLYTVIQDVHQLQAMKDALGERYVLGNDIDASATVSWNAGAGFAPIKTFNGTLDGLGYAIHGLTIYRPSTDEVGLFGVTGGSAVLRNIRLEDINVTGRNQVGGLVGRSGGSIENAHTSGTVSGNGQVGGLVGAQARNLSKITGSSSMADVSGTGDSIGGLVGTTASALLVTIQDSHAGGAVSGGSQVGGLVGWTNWTTISNAFATGAVSGGTKVGGLVGWAFGQSSISNAFATGAVSGGTEVGGLVGYSEGEIRDSYATGTVTGADKVGGLVGLSIKEIRDSHAAGTVTGKNQVGGLVGHAVWSSSISNSYATGDVTGEDMVGGLVGQSEADSASTASISNSHASGTVSGNEAVGGLVGWNEKLITDSTASGAVTGDSEVGGLVGTNAEHFSGVYGRIEKSSASGDVTGTGRAVGGLAGVNAGRIDDSYASGAVHGRTKVGGLVGWGSATSSVGEHRVTGSYATGDVTGTDYDVGGLVGDSSRMLISHSFATGAVSGVSRVGGLVGFNSGPYYNGNRIEYSFATGTVSGTGNAIGGLVGSNDAYIYRSYAEGAVQGNGNVGGLVGEHRDDRRVPPEGVDPLGVIEQSFATGAVNGSGSNIGGLVGDNRAIIRQSYASGAVSGDSNVGGLVGQQAQLTSSSGMVEQSYASGAVSGGSNVGGLVGHDDGGAGVVESCWDQEATGQTTSVGGTGLSSAQMRELASFAGWSIDDQGGTNSVWRIYEGHTAPLLRAFLTPFEVDVDAVTTTYNGGNHRALNSDQLSYDTPTLDLFTGELGYLASSRNVGTYSGADLRLVGLYSSQQGYDIIANGELTINPAELTITSTDVIKTYDGSTGAAGTAHVMAGALYGTDTLSGGVFTFTDKNVGIGNKTVTVSDVTVEDGNGGANYTITYEDNTTSTINPFVINLSGSRVYDGGVDVEADVLTLGSLAGDETLSLSGTGFMADKHVGDGKVFQLGSLSLGDGDQGGLASNYTLEGGSHSVTITPAQLRISTSDIIKTYDGTTDAAGTTVAVAGTKLFDTDSLIGGIFAFADKNAGVGNKTVTVSDVTVDDGNGGANYTITYVDNTTSTINPRPVVVTANAQTKTYGDYDPELNFTVEEVSSGRGLLAEDSLSGELSREVGEDVGRYAITQGSLNNSNYIISFNGAELSIDPRAITLAAEAVSKVYGEADPTLSVRITGGSLGSYAVSDTLADITGTLSRAGGTDVGSYNVLLGEGTKAGNYRITFDADNKAFSITPRPITITAHNQSKTYGDSDPALSYTVEAQSTGRGLLAGDSLSGTLSRAEGENVGRYAITQGTLANSNYAISFSGAELSIDPRAITLAADVVSKIYGEADPTFSVQIVGGNLGSETVSDALADVTGSLRREDGENVGDYSVLLGSGAKAGNYFITFDTDNKAVSITPRPVTVAAHNHSKAYGDFNPTLSYTVEAQSVGRGLLAGDSLNGELSRVAGEDVGTYVIGQGSLANSNYDISFSGAELSIDPRAITLAADLVSKIYGEGDPTLSVRIIGGSLGSETVSDTLADVTGDLSRAAGSDVGSYNVLLGEGAKADNYLITFDVDNQAFTITPRSIRVTADDQHKYQGEADPVFTWHYDASALVSGDKAETLFSGSLARAMGEEPGIYTINLGSLQSGSNYTIDFVPGELQIEAAGIVRRLGDRGKSYQDALVVALQSAAQAGPGPASNICFELTASSEPDDSDCSDYPVTGFAFGMSQASDGISVVQGLYSIVNGGLRLPEGFDEQ